MPQAAPKHFIERIATRVDQEIERDSSALAQRLADEVLDDHQDLSTPEFLALFRERYASDPNFAPMMVTRMGPAAFNAAYAAAYGLPKSQLTLARAMAGMAGHPEALPDGLPAMGNEPPVPTSPQDVANLIAPPPGPAAPTPVMPPAAPLPPSGAVTLPQ